LGSNNIYYYYYFIDLHTLYHTGNKDYNIKITVNFDKV